MGIRGKGRVGGYPVRTTHITRRPDTPRWRRVATTASSIRTPWGTGRDGTLPPVICPDRVKPIESAHPDGIGVSGGAAISPARRASDPCGNQPPRTTQEISEHLFKYLKSQFHDCVG